MLRKTRNQISPKLRKIEKELQKVPAKAHKFFVSVTPKRTGNARRKTSLSGDTIKADYPYAQRLDDGWSKQAPKGMVQPTIKYITKLVKQIIGK